MLLHRRATEELWPHFLATQAPVGMRGLLLGGLLAAALVVVDMTGLASIASLKRIFPRRTAGTERVLATLSSLVAMVLATLFTFVVPFPADTALFAVASSLAPLAALVMLGLTSRRASSGVALAALICGVAGAIAMSLWLSADPRQRIHPMWSVTLSFAGTFVIGHLLAMVFGESRRRNLRGLVLGPSPIGAIGEELPPEIVVRDAESSSERWK
jgi:Na+/proline symporter